jgi:hypothetical protein
MDISLETFIILILFGTIFYLSYLYNYYSKLTKIKSTFDSREYYVQDKDDALEAANLIGQIREKIITLIEHLKKSYPNDERTQRLSNNYRENSLKEGVSDPRYTSYSVNKGEEIVLCIRNKDKLMELNTMIFVVLHELSHLASESIGHTDEFWTNFRWILEESINIGVYKHQEFNKKSIEYCGMSITSSPLDYVTKFDGKLFEGFKLDNKYLEN